jgi:hypothetical protein
MRGWVFRLAVAFRVQCETRPQTLRQDSRGGESRSGQENPLDRKVREGSSPSPRTNFTLPRFEASSTSMSDEHKIDQAVLALLYLTLHEDGSAWKGFAFPREGFHRRPLFRPPGGIVL